MSSNHGENCEKWQSVTAKCQQKAVFGSCFSLEAAEGSGNSLHRGTWLALLLNREYQPSQFDTCRRYFNAMEVSTLIKQLGSKDPVERQKARETLVKRGGPEVTRALCAELTDPRPHLRWEAAKGLTAIGDPVASLGLLHALEDNNQDVRWVAAEGLVALGEHGLLTVLSGLTRRARSPEFCESAYHALHKMKKSGHAEVIDPVLIALEGSEPEVTAPVAADKALAAMKNV
jgi:hypothetical protein